MPGTEPSWSGELRVLVLEPRIETRSAHDGQAEDGVPSTGSMPTYVSYGVRAESALPHFACPHMATRKRFQDFAFLHDALEKEFPACIIPPLPGKHRIGYLTGDRFSHEFIQRRVAELQQFMERICRHPILQRAGILEQFLASHEWHIAMHNHSGRPITAQTSDDAQAHTPSLLESMSDTIVNTFARVRKPDPRFAAIDAALDAEDGGATQLERVFLRNRTHVSDHDDLRMLEVAAFDELYATPIGASIEDLASDYRDFSTALHKVALLESGLTKPMANVAEALRTYSDMHTMYTMGTTDTLIARLHSTRAFLSAHKALLKHREAEQLDFEGLTDYLSHETTERARLEALGAHGGNIRGTGLRGYMRSTVDKVWGVDEEQARIERMQRLDDRIHELHGAAEAARENAIAMNEHVVQEHNVFELGRRRELVQFLGALADGNIEMHTKGLAVFDKLVKELEEGVDEHDT
ncbi:intercellular trafficking and secretion [Malassezia vespertilionis]|uniref:Sorting nexin-4 n=1 Tax=Malassezia vespertilionis TaxID=2020962 RepID=A0A2N1J869_9BASI|nr:intercellular trafficking and secretion [Malassezia vespertilionis]PKI82761.1 Snx4p [Malassezia vespertilionis]WFD08330.1 intercellular trafficking and secretion [Malassezia vespertilionis]